jgi:hypothetical protein
VDLPAQAAALLPALDHFGELLLGLAHVGSASQPNPQGQADGGSSDPLSRRPAQSPLQRAEEPIIRLIWYLSETRGR